MSDSFSKPSDLVPVSVPARDIYPPTTISAEARAALSAGAAMPATSFPEANDLDGWRKAIAAGDAMWGPMADGMLAACKSPIETKTIGGVTCYVTTQKSPAVYLYMHGGAMVFGGGKAAKAFGAATAERLGVTTVSVDYRMPPDHPFPAAPEDCVAVYRGLIETHDSSRIVIGGVSAGGNLAAAATLMIRDRGLPMPAAVLLLTPEMDLTEAGDSFKTNLMLDTTLKRTLPQSNALYAAGHDLMDPYVSPLFGDYRRGFPPTFVQSGTRDLFLSNSVLIHRKLRRAGIEAELHVWEAMPHGGFGFGPAPENREIDQELKRFIARHTETDRGDRI